MSWPASNGQFEEEVACLNHARRLQWPLWTAPLQHYLGRLVGSFRDQLFACAIWVLAVAVLYWLVNDTAYWTAGDPPYRAPRASPTVLEWVVKLAEVVLLVNSTDSFPTADLTWRTVRCLEYLCGFTHMGIFASRLFLLLLRR